MPYPACHENTFITSLADIADDIQPMLRLILAPCRILTKENKLQMNQNSCAAGRKNGEPGSMALGGGSFVLS